MHVTVVEVVAALVVGGAASALGGYLGGTSLATKYIGRDLAGFLGMLYGPAAGLTGVAVGLVVIAVFSSTS